jgi:hypothetical protein
MLETPNVEMSVKMTKMFNTNIYYTYHVQNTSIHENIKKQKNTFSETNKFLDL